MWLKKYSDLFHQKGICTRSSHYALAKTSQFTKSKKIFILLNNVKVLIISFTSYRNEITSYNKNLMFYAKT